MTGRDWAPDAYEFHEETKVFVMEWCADAMTFRTEPVAKIERVLIALVAAEPPAGLKPCSIQPCAFLVEKEATRCSYHRIELERADERRRMHAAWAEELGEY